MNKWLLAMLILPGFIVAGCGAQDKAKDENSAQIEDSTENVDTAENSAAVNGDSALKTDTKPKRDSEVVAEVNGVPIYKDELKGRKIDELITEEVLYQKGLALGLDQKYEQKLRDYKKQLIVHEMKSDILENQPLEKEISDEEIQAYYDKNKSKYTFVRMREVVFKDKQLGDEIRSKVESGQDLAEIVTGYVESGVDVVGLDIGYNRQMVQKFDTLEVGAVTDVIEKPDGTFSVLKIVEVKPIPLKQTERPIRSLLEAKRKGAAYDEYANQVIEESGAEVEITNN